MGVQKILNRLRAVDLSGSSCVMVAVVYRLVKNLLHQVGQVFGLGVSTPNLYGIIITMTIEADITSKTKLRHCSL